MGIPVVRRLGPGVPLHPAGAGRSGVRQGPARPATREWYMHPNGQLPAYEWAFGDVNPPVHAWAAWRVYKIDRTQRAATRRPRLSRARLPQAAAQLHLVGQPQGRRGPQHLPGRLSRPGQHRRLRPQRAAADRRASSTRPTAPPGWRCTALNMLRDRAGAGPARPRLRGHRHQVLRALPAHRRGDEQHRRATASACGTRRTSSSTTSCTCRTAACAAARSARWSG